MFDIEAYKKYEQYFMTEKTESFELLSGKGKLIVSAPHSVEQTRNGSKKFSEPQTGVIAKMLHDELGIPVIYKTKNCGDDANYDAVSPYKDALVEYIKENKIEFMLDLHQLSQKRDVMIDIGTGKYKNVKDPAIVEVAYRIFEKYDLGRIEIDTPFDASYPYTLSSYIARNCNISCLQLELNSKLVRTDSSSSKEEKVFSSLVELIDVIESTLSQNYEKE